jgi:hypothetical protein
MQLTKKHLALAFAFVVLCWIAMPSVYSAAPRGQATQWEYKVNTNVGMVQVPELNSAGTDGWDLVSVAVESTGNCTAVFKRPK